MADCTLCPRMCHADRRNRDGQHAEAFNAGHSEEDGRHAVLRQRAGFCGMSAEIYAARAALHFWEEPCISGKSGSGTVFFSGCNLRCVYCQNREISRGEAGKAISAERLRDIFLSLESKGAANINLVTPTHYVPQIVRALELAKEAGMKLPVVYNSSGYERVETLRLLEGLVDIYLPDMKYSRSESAARYSGAPDYPERVKEALAEMVRQTGSVAFSEETGMLKRGVVVRHLVLPGHVKEAGEIIRYLVNSFGDRIYISIMNQYTPCTELADYPELDRKVTKREYERVLQEALDAGVENGFFQEGGTAKESFIPPFTGEGI